MNKLQKRNECDPRFCWRLEDIFPSVNDWEKSFTAVEKEIPELPALKEKMKKGGKSLADALKKIDKVSHELERLYVYARMRLDENTANPTHQALNSRATSLAVKLSAALAFIEPLILQLDEEQLLKEIAEEKSLSDYRFRLSDLLRGKEHILSEKEEIILSKAEEFAGGAKDIFTMLNNADIKFPTVIIKGERIPLSHGTYISCLQSKNRSLRKKAYLTYYAEYQKNLNTIASTYATSVKKDVFYADARGYESALAHALFPDNVPTRVYDSLIRDVNENLPVLHRYMRLRKKLLGLKKQYMYDVFAPVSKDIEWKFTYEKAKETVLRAVAPLGEDYVADMRSAFDSGWVDVYENEGKRSGAYSWGVYGTHPYVLLNFNGDLDSVFTIAHEMGHAMHTYYSNKAQPYATSEYTIFVAEVASTVNEILLTKYLLNITKDKEIKKSLLAHYIDQFRTTVLRQTQFAEFEKETHERAQRGEPLTAEIMSQLYAEINERYYGKDMTTDDIIGCEWARIPHFYTAFYVYKYATGFSCASAIVKNIENKKSRDAYRKFLTLGGSDYPITLLENAGIDFDTVVKECLSEFGNAVEELEKIYRS